MPGCVVKMKRGICGVWRSPLPPITPTNARKEEGKEGSTTKWSKVTTSPLPPPPSPLSLVTLTIVDHNMSTYVIPLVPLLHFVVALQ